MRAKMEIRARVHLSSSWEVGGDLNAVLYIVSSSGNLLDEPLPNEQQATPISLCAPTSDPHRPCQLHIDLSHLRGYISSHIELTSTSRTTELYRDEDDYVGTVRGSVAGNCDSNEGDSQRLYHCDHSLPSGGKFLIKLLSLRGRTEVIIDRIQLVVTEDHGGSTTPPGETTVSDGPVGVQELLSSLPVSTMPSFMQSLVSSLSHLTTQTGCERVATDADRPPAELSRLVQALRQLRPHPPPSLVETRAEVDSHSDTRENGEIPEDLGESDSTAVESVEQADLEARLKLYIDNKFALLERKLEKRFEELFSSRLKDLNSRPLHIIQEDGLD